MDGHSGKRRWPMSSELKIPKAHQVPPFAERKALRVNTWCYLNDTSRSHAYELMRRGELPYYYVGKTRRIPVEQADPES
jgi:excisionase family DNA binding protein